MAEGVDYSGTRPDPAQLYAAGKRFAVRYGGPGGSWKHMTAAEAASLTAAGLALVANAEGAADGLLGGWDAGVSWARSADVAFRALGMPADRPIYLSVDFDCGPDKQWAAVAQALQGAAAVLGGSRVGVYGSYDVMQWAKRDAVARWFWQTYAWSGGRWAGHNHLEQYRNGVSLAGGTVDLCRSKVADYGQWGVDDMALEQADIDKIVAGVWGKPIVGRDGKTTYPASSYVRNTLIGVQVDLPEQIRALRADVAGVDEATAAALKQKLDAILAAALDDTNVTVQLPPDAIATLQEIKDAVAAIPAELGRELTD